MDTKATSIGLVQKPVGLSSPLDLRKRKKHGKAKLLAKERRAADCIALFGRLFLDAAQEWCNTTPYDTYDQARDAWGTHDITNDTRKKFETQRNRLASEFAARLKTVFPNLATHNGYLLLPTYKRKPISLKYALRMVLLAELQDILQRNFQTSADAARYDADYELQRFGQFVTYSYRK